MVWDLHKYNYVENSIQTSRVLGFYRTNKYSILIEKLHNSFSEKSSVVMLYESIKNNIFKFPVSCGILENPLANSHCPFSDLSWFYSCSSTVFILLKYHLIILCTIVSHFSCFKIFSTSAICS